MQQVWENESGNEIRLKELSDPFIQFDEKSYFTPEKKYVDLSFPEPALFIFKQTIERIRSG